MKRLLMFFFACILIMTSCSKNDVIENVTDGQGQLSFVPGVGKQSATRAAELDNTALQTAAATTGIQLYAYQNVGSAWSEWYDDAVVYTGGKWGLKKSVRFRNENETKYITYFSTSDELAEVKDATETTKSTFETATFTSGKYPAFTYVVADDSGVQEDLIAGVTEVDAKKTDVTLGMRHILSQVNFGVKGYKWVKIQIQNIKVHGVSNSATFTYNAENVYPIGTWSDFGKKESTYPYFNYSNKAEPETDPVNLQPVIPVDANTGDVYIFGDGGKWGPGKAATTFYPVKKDGGWVSSPQASQTGLSNSLMLLPQKLESSAKVTFEYKIQDVSDGFVAGNETTWAQGEFSLNFSTGTTSGKNYNSEWEQNYRYLYLIDFTDFLDDNALSFKVDVEAYPWENYNVDGDNDGIVDITVTGMPTNIQVNNLPAGSSTWYVASRSTDVPTKDAQLVGDATWNFSSYDFKNLTPGNTLTLNFDKVIFNTGKTITLTVPAGYTVTQNNAALTDNKITAGTYPVIITKNYDAANIAALATLLNASATNGKTYYVGDNGAGVDLSLVKPNLQIKGQKVTVVFKTVVTSVTGDGWQKVGNNAVYTNPYDVQTIDALATLLNASATPGATYRINQDGGGSVDLSSVTPKLANPLQTVTVMFNTDITGILGANWAIDGTNAKVAVYTKPYDADDIAALETLLEASPTAGVTYTINDAGGIVNLGTITPNLAGGATLKVLFTGNITSISGFGWAIDGTDAKVAVYTKPYADFDALKVALELPQAANKTYYINQPASAVDFTAYSFDDTAMAWGAKLYVIFTDDSSSDVTSGKWSISTGSNKATYTK